MSLVAAREFLLGAYHDLPNVLFIGSLILGSIFGYLPLVWVAVGLILNGSIVSIIQGILAVVLENNYSQVFVEKGSYACEILKSDSYTSKVGNTIVTPSHWLSATAFFATFSIYNSIKVAMKESAEGVSGEKTDVRRAFSLSVLIIGLAFFGLILLRGFTGCETWLGSISGIIIGSGVGIGYWHLLDVCGTGMVPDVLQVIGSMAPPGSQREVPVVCSPIATN
jgi:hypothetical protein